MEDLVLVQTFDFSTLLLQDGIKLISIATFTDYSNINSCQLTPFLAMFFF